MQPDLTITHIVVIFFIFIALFTITQVYAHIIPDWQNDTFNNMRFTNRSSANNTQESHMQQGVAPALRTFYTLTNFSGQKPEQWKNYLYGATIVKSASSNVCALRGGTYQRCGTELAGRNHEFALRVSDFTGIRMIMKNTGAKVFENVRLTGYLDWHTQNGTGYVRTGIAPARDFNFTIPKLKPGVSTEVRIPWTAIQLEDGFVFDPSKDLLTGVAVGRSPYADLPLHIEQIQLYGPTNATVQYQRESHEGGFVVLKKASGAEYTFPKFDSADRWGEPFAGYQAKYGSEVLLTSGDTIWIHGIVPCGAIFRVNGTKDTPVTIQGATSDATLDGTFAKQKCQAGREGDLLTLEGEYFVVKNLRLRNAGSDFGYAENATAMNITDSKNVLIDRVEITNAGMGVRSSNNSDNLVFQNSRVVGSGYPGAGHYHNIYLRGSNHTVENVFSGYALGGQDLKVRACNTKVHASTFTFAKNFEIDYPDDENPAGCEHIFSGNTVIPDPEPVNSGQIFTFFSDGASLQHSGALYATNNTFIDVEEEGRNTPLFRVGTPPEGKKMLYLNNNMLGFRNLEFTGNTNPDRQGGEMKGSNNFMLPDAQGAIELLNSIIGTDPGLVRLGFEFTPSETSALRDAGNAASYLPTKQFGLPEAFERPSIGVIDIGAREYVPQQVSCTELWVCEEWNACQRDGSEQRTCADRNNCGTTRWRPVEQQSCTFVCAPQWECTPWGTCDRNGTQERTCYDVNECGDTNSMPPVSQSCTPACQGSVRIQNTPQNINSVIQSRLSSSYPDFGYDAPDNRINQTSFYNVLFPEVTNALPDDSEVTSAQLLLNFYQQYVNETLMIYPLLEFWGTDGSGHASMRLREGAYDAYNRTSSSSEQEAWRQFGGTIGERLLEVLVENPQRANTIEKQFNITALVRQWHEGASENFGIQLRAAGTQGFQDIFGANKFDNQSKNLGPQLLIEYQCR